MHIYMQPKTENTAAVTDQRGYGKDGQNEGNVGDSAAAYPKDNSSFFTCLEVMLR